jgi:hypothetical protein
MKNDGGFIYDDSDFSEEDQNVLKKIRGGLQDEAAIDPVTGRKQKKTNILNKKKLSKQEMDEFFLDY